MDVGAGLDALGDEVEEGGELFGPVAVSRAAIRQTAPLRLQSCAGLRVSGLHRQGLLRAPEPLDPRLLVHRDDHRMVSLAGS